MTFRLGAAAPGTWLVLPTLAIAVFASYLPSLWVSFMADDYTMLRTADRADGFGSTFGENDLGQPGEVGHFYRPLWVLWNAGLLRLAGADATAFHAGNLILYLLVAIEVWALARRLLGGWGGWIAGIAFAVYPRHGESVAWVSGNTDLTATVLALAALLVLSSSWPTWRRTVLVAGLTAGAALAKESTFVLPALALLLFWAESRREDRSPRSFWPAFAGMLAALVAVAVARTIVLDGIGGYAEYPWTAKRALVAAVSYVAAALTPPQLQVLRHPALLIVPVLVLGLLAFGILRLVRTRRRTGVTIVAAGLIWFCVSLLPSLNLVVDLNNANGERLLFLPSVGLALAVAAVISLEVRGLWRFAVLGGVILAAALSLHNSFNWITGGQIADRVLESAVELGPTGGELVVLSVPAAYRTAHVFRGSLDVAVERAGRPDLAVALCLPVQVMSERPGQVEFRARGDGSYEGTTTWSAPFDFPISGGTAVLGPDCSYARGEGGERSLGLGLRGVATPVPSRTTVVYAFYDGGSIRELSRTG